MTDSILPSIDPERIAQDTLDFLRVRSETGAEGPGSEFLAALLRREGFAVELDEVAPGRPNVYCRIAGSGGGPALMLNGHTDTIPVGASAPPAREGDWLVGRGAEDMKGGLVAMVHAASALRRAGVRLRGDLWVTGVIDHETPAGRKAGPRRLIEKMHAGEIPAAGVIIAEGPHAIWSASLGSCIFRVRLASARGPCHTIKAPYRESPARWAGRLLEQFAEWEDRWSRVPPHPLCGRERIDVGIAAGGDYPNRLPTPFDIVGTWRWQPGKTEAAVRAELEDCCRALAQASGLDVACSLEAAREPFETPADHPLVAALRAAGAAVLGRPPERIGMALVGDANLYANGAGVPVVYFGPAHETAHSDLERVSLARLAACAAVYAHAAAAFCR